MKITNISSILLYCNIVRVQCKITASLNLNINTDLHVVFSNFQIIFFLMCKQAIQNNLCILFSVVLFVLNSVKLLDMVSF